MSAPIAAAPHPAATVCTTAAGWSTSCRLEKHSVSPWLGDVSIFVSGAAAGAVSDGLCHPIDTINTRLKMQLKPPYKYDGIWRTAKLIAKEEGVRGLFGGLGTCLISTVPSTGIYFFTYEQLKTLGERRLGPEHQTLVHFFAGAASEVSCSVVYIPFEVVKTRLQLGSDPSRSTGGFVTSQANYRGTFHALSSIIRAEGVRGLYAGMGSCLLLDCSYSAVQVRVWSYTHPYTIAY